MPQAVCDRHTSVGMEQLGAASSLLSVHHCQVASANSLSPSCCRTTQHGQFAVGRAQSGRGGQVLPIFTSPLLPPLHQASIHSVWTGWWWFGPFSGSSGKQGVGRQWRLGVSHFHIHPTAATGHLAMVGGVGDGEAIAAIISHFHTPHHCRKTAQILLSLNGLWQ